MYKIYYEHEFFEDLSNFSGYLKDYFYKLYSDTGIINEDIIINSYFDSINLLHKTILDKIDESCLNGLLGRHIVNDNDNIEDGFFLLKINSYKLKTFFTLNKKERKISIKSISIKT